MKNTEKALKNSLISVIGQILSLLLQFINRRVFIMFLEIELLGYQSLFSNIFSVLSVAELGIESVISFHLYKEIADHNETEIGKLMYLYKWVYRIIALIILVLGSLGYFLIPYIIQGSILNKEYLAIIYFLQLASIFLGYFLSYRRTLYVAHQKEYRCVQYDLYSLCLIQAIQVITLFLFKNYILYLSLQLSTSVIANIMILNKTNKEYPYLKKQYKITMRDIKKRNFIPDIRNLIVHKICYAVYSGTDNVIISAFCGIRQVALYGNYFLLQKGVMQILFYKLLNPIQATIGNIVYGNRNKQALWEQFQMLDVFSFFFASFIGIGFLVFFQPAIQVWMGNDYLLRNSFVIYFAISIYMQAVFEIIYKYRSVFGEYQSDRNCMIVSAILNIIFSTLLAQKFGVTGVQLGTMLAYLPIAYGRIRFVIKNYFEKSIKTYLIKHFRLFIVFLLEGLISYLIAFHLDINLLGILLRFVTWLFVPLVINILVFYKNQHFKALCRYLLRFYELIKNIV